MLHIKIKMTVKVLHNCYFFRSLHILTPASTYGRKGKPQQLFHTYTDFTQIIEKKRKKSSKFYLHRLPIFEVPLNFALICIHNVLRHKFLYDSTPLQDFPRRLGKLFDMSFPYYRCISGLCWRPFVPHNFQDNKSTNSHLVTLLLL